MIKYSNKNRPLYSDSASSYASDFLRENLLNPKYLQSKPPALNLTKQTKQKILQLNLTPRTAKAQLQRSAKPVEMINLSANVTPDKERIRKDNSFVMMRNKKDAPFLDLRLQYTGQAVAVNEVKTDRSQQLFKTKQLNQEASRCADEIARLRQTVSNSTAWQFRTNYTPSNQSFKENDQPIIRKKIQSQYTEIKKDLKSKFSSKQHSRNNSRTQQFIDPPPFFAQIKREASKTPTKIPRVSQDRLTSSTISKDKLMNQTDPTGSYFQLSLSKKPSNKTPELKIQDFQLGACKGQGRFGKVYPALHKKSGYLLAIKKVAKQSVRLMLDQFVQQIKISLYLNHPNIVKMYGCFSDRENIYIMLQYMEQGCLYKHVKLAKKFSEEETSTKLQEICQAVKYLHSYDILHRDIKPQNIVISNGVCKLCDFGWAIYSKERRNTYCGTLDYVCPEILQGESYDNFVDIWAIGVLAFEMLVGKAPFYHISRKQTMKSILNCEFSFPTDMSVGAKLFIMKALQKKPDLRFTIDSLMKDRFLSQTRGV